MNWRRWVWGLLAGVWFIPSVTGAIEIIDPILKRPLYGFEIRGTDQKKLVMRIRTPDGKYQTKEYERAKVIIKASLDIPRLEKLAKDKPQEYFAYAEELAKKKNDPEFHETAMRLFVIAAYLDAEQLGPRSLHHLSTLAETPAEARKYKAMAVLLDLASDPQILKREDAKPSSPATQDQAAALASFQKALHFYRTGEPAKAKEHANHKSVDKFFSLAPGMMDHKAFLQICNDAVCTTCKMKKVVKCTSCGGTGRTVDQNGETTACTACNGKGKNKCADCDGSGVNPNFPPDKLRMVIRAELWALSSGSGNNQPGTTETSWSSILQTRKIGPVPIMDLRTISEFDPRKCVFREGKWVVP